jgi:lipoic acid synthetase
MENLRRPEWLKKKIDFDKNRETSLLLNSLQLNTVCQEAKCPNISECFKNHHATFLILGKYCTRHCKFCAVEKSTLENPDPKEPQTIAACVKQMGLKHVVITSVTRDDLSDGGAAHFAKTVLEIKKLENNPSIELLIPDFKGQKHSLKTIVKSKPDIIGHNIETIPRLYSLRPEASYKTSLEVLENLKRTDKTIYTKSALLLGLGENKDEVLDTLKDLKKVRCDFLALGQYLQPTLNNVAVAEYIRPEQFLNYKNEALNLGFKHVESNPYVRSSYNAANYLS